MDRSLADVVSELHETFKNHRICLSVAESCTGGMVGQEITTRPGSSNFFVGGVVAYSNDLKERLLRVEPEILEQHGAVSEPVAREMANGILERTSSDYALSVTGVAGPSGGTPEKPVGLVYLGFASKSDSKVEECQFSGDREKIRRSTTQYSLKRMSQYAGDEIS